MPEATKNREPLTDEEQVEGSFWDGLLGLKASHYPQDKPPEGAQVVHVVHPRRDLPKGDLKKHGIDYAVHFLVGFAAALGMLVGPALENAVVAVPFVMLVVFICVRQTVEFMRRRDTPGRDLQHYMMGYMGGLGIGALLLWRAL